MIMIYPEGKENTLTFLAFLHLLRSVADFHEDSNDNILLYINMIIAIIIMIIIMLMIVYTICNISTRTSTAAGRSRP